MEGAIIITVGAKTNEVLNKRGKTLFIYVSNFLKRLRLRFGLVLDTRFDIMKHNYNIS